MHGILHDLRFAVRTLRRSPGYAAVSLLTLAVGIGAITSVFSLVRGVLLRPLPYPAPGELVRVQETNAGGETMSVAWGNLVDWREGARTFERLVAHGTGAPATVLGAGGAARLRVTPVSRGFFRTLGVEPARGRAFLAGEHRPGAEPVAVVGHGLWRDRLGSDPDLDARRLEVSGYSLRIVGVMPRGFDYPAGTDIWYPLELTEPVSSRTAHNYLVLGRLADGATPERADAELDAITAGFAEGAGAREAAEVPEFFPAGARVERLHDALVGESRRPLAILLGASALLLLVACTNLASTSLARGVEREAELALRRSLGAGGGRLLRQLFTESLVLALAGAALGLGLAFAALRAAPALASGFLPRIEAVRMDGVVLLFTLGTAVMTAVLFGLLPARRLGEREVAGALRSGRRGGQGPGRTRAWRWLVASEVALAVLLLAGCGLLVRSFVTVLRVEPGFRTGGVLTATVHPPAGKYPDGGARARYYGALLAELETLPGVAAVGLAAHPPLAGITNGAIDVRDGARERITADYQLVGGDYFSALGIPLLRGRTFGPGDVPEGGHVVLVNEALAAVAWPGEDPLGKRITGGGMDDHWDRGTWATVVGVVGDVRQRDLTRPAEPTFYFGYRQRPFRSWTMTAALRPAAGPPGRLAGPVRDAVRRVDPDVPVAIATIEERVSRAVADRRFSLLVLGGFAAAALALACVGIYGVVAYTVARRTREIGIRVALGADPRSVRRFVRRQSMGGVALGAGTGLVLALGLTRLLRGLLFGVGPADPVVLATALAAAGAAGWLAAFLPSLRGSRLHPAEAIRAD